MNDDKLWDEARALKKAAKTEIKRQVSASARLPLLDSGLDSMSHEKFKRMYEGEFKQDPLLQSVVEFLRTATFKEVSIARKEGWLTQELHRDAKRILERQ